MKNYVSQAETAELTPKVTELYPNFAQNAEDYPLADDNPFAIPNPLVVEAMHLFGKEPKRILDIGTESGRHALYLASHGHNVLAIDTNDESLEYMRERARSLGLSNRQFRFQVGDVRDLDASDRYDGILAGMLLHFLDKADSDRAVQAIQSMTLPAGANIVSAYTEDNPVDEITDKERGLTRFLTKTELADHYGQTGWSKEFQRVGPGFKAMYRPHKGKFLVPTIAEVIAQRQPVRVASESPAPRISSDYLQHLSTANPELYEYYAQSGQVNHLLT